MDHENYESSDESLEDDNLFQFLVGGNLEMGYHDDYDDDDLLEFNHDERDHISNEDNENTDDDSSEVELRDSHIYIPREHANTILLMLKKQYEQSQNLDLTIKTSNSEIKVHKCLIAACSPYINTYFQNSLGSNSIDLSHHNPECIKKIIDWCYSGYIKVSVSDVQDFLVAADFLCIDHVFKNCTDFILKRLTLENCYEIFSLSCNFQACDFKNKVKRYMLNNFGQLFKQDLEKLPREELVEIISDSSLVLADDEGFPITDGDLEFKLFYLIKKYLSDNSLLNYWPDVLKNGLRLSLMSEQQLKEIIEDFNKNLEFEDKKVCLKLLKDSMQCRKSKKPENSIWLKPRINLERLRYYNSSELATSYMHEDQSQPEPFNDIDSRKGIRLFFVVAMTVRVRPWGSTMVVGGLEITYNNGSVINHGGTDPDWQTNYFKLEPGEKITSVVIKSGWVVDSLMFRTNKQRSFGPYGGNGGGERIIKPKPSNGFLGTIKGCVVKSLGSLLIRKISFVWGYLKKSHTVSP